MASTDGTKDEQLASMKEELESSRMTIRITTLGLLLVAIIELVHLII